MGTLWCVLVEMKKRGHFLVRTPLDQSELSKMSRLAMADFTLLCQSVVFTILMRALRPELAWFQAVDLRSFDSVAACAEPTDWALIPRPRLCYLGPAVPDHLNLSVVRELLQKHPSGISSPLGPALARSPERARASVDKLSEVPIYVSACEVRFMPYNCDERQLHANPLKLWDYFVVGKPVVATPLIHLWEYEDVIYRGHSTDLLEKAILAALSEPADSPKCQRRMKIAREHSIENLSAVLREVLPMGGVK
jgi:hypothetical protein